MIRSSCHAISFDSTSARPGDEGTLVPEESERPDHAQPGHGQGRTRPHALYGTRVHTAVYYSRTCRHCARLATIRSTMQLRLTVLTGSFVGIGRMVRARNISFAERVRRVSASDAAPAKNEKTHHLESIACAVFFIPPLIPFITSALRRSASRLRISRSRRLRASCPSLRPSFSSAALSARACTA